jgi:hypothetical protein
VRDGADQARVQHLLEGGHVVAEAVLRHDGQDPVVLGGGRDHRVALLERGCHRLLDEHVDAGAQRGDRQLGVRGRRRRDADEVQVLCREQVLDLFVRPGGGEAELRAQRGGLAGSDVAQGDDLALSPEPPVAVDVGAGDPAGPDDADPEHCSSATHWSSSTGSRDLYVSLVIRVTMVVLGSATVKGGRRQGVSLSRSGES